jgi:hypothetical protein
MRKILFLFMFLSLLVILFLLSLPKKPPITGCLGLTLGMPKNEAIHQLASRIDTTEPFTMVTKCYNEIEIYYISDFYFAVHHFDQISLSFYDGKLYKIILVKECKDESKIEPIFSDLKLSYKIKYNKPYAENNSSIEWKDIYNNSISIVLSYDANLKKRLLITYVDDNIDKKFSLEKEKKLQITNLIITQFIPFLSKNY